jgi:hypothetical protein
MEEEIVKWKKDKTIVEHKDSVVCDCGGVMNNLGSTCSLDDGSFGSYLYQCVDCKTIEMSWEDHRSEDMTKYGWKKLPNN